MSFQKEYNITEGGDNDEKQSNVKGKYKSRLKKEGGSDLASRPNIAVRRDRIILSTNRYRERDIVRDNKTAIRRLFKSRRIRSRTNERDCLVKTR